MDQSTPNATQGLLSSAANVTPGLFSRIYFYNSKDCVYFFHQILSEHDYEVNFCFPSSLSQHTPRSLLVWEEKQGHAFGSRQRCLHSSAPPSHLPAGAMLCLWLHHQLHVRLSPEVQALDFCYSKPRWTSVVQTEGTPTHHPPLADASYHPPLPSRLTLGVTSDFPLFLSFTSSQ